jgi:hypothetical protein
MPMNNRPLIVCLALVQFCDVALAQDRSTPSTAPNINSAPSYITHVMMIDIYSDKEDNEGRVIISEDRISEVRDSNF